YILVLELLEVVLWSVCSLGGVCGLIGIRLFEVKGGLWWRLLLLLRGFVVSYMVLFFFSK
ncbi:hypothetical protein QT224_12355, partial [Escherichia coli]|uniref:hypothetical protein n=1 Tax=Escherichia coli TaxID=562 RepID=UPI00259CEC91